MKIYVDIGNSNIKLNVLNKKNVYFFIPTKSSYTTKSLWLLLPQIIKIQKIQKIFICSVVPKITSIFEELIKKHFKLKPIIIDLSLKLGVKLNIDNPKSLGHDLISLSAYANHISSNTIIVNLGTTTTIIYVKNKILNGVIIMPGLDIQLNSILENTAKIKNISVEHEKNYLGKNTKQALSIGIINSHIYSIKKHINNIDTKAKVIFSGGNAKKIMNGVNFQYINEATIEGMKIIEELNDK